MRVTDLDRHFKRQTTVAIRILDTGEIYIGTMEYIMAKYEEYRVCQILPWENKNTHKHNLLIVAETPVKVGRPRKKA